MTPSQERRELIDDSIDKLQQFFEQWNNRLTIDNLRFAERYAKGEIEIIIELERRIDISRFQHRFRYGVVLKRNADLALPRLRSTAIPFEELKKCIIADCGVELHDRPANLH